MYYIPEPIFDNFIIELDMYCNHLNYVLEELDLLDERIKKEFELIQGNYDPENTDEGEVWFQATENILGKDTTFIPYYQKVGAIAGFCVIIFHFFERFLEEISYLKDNEAVEGFDKFGKRYPQMVAYKGYDKIDELRLVANYCKHGRGNSESCLRKKRPDYFDTLSFRLGRAPLKPLSGYDIKITKKDFDDYIHSIKQIIMGLKEEWVRV